MNTKTALVIGVLGSCVVGLHALGSICFAQNYRCDWSVNGSGGGGMIGAYACGATVGQTAAGQITGSNYWALIGFWQTEGATGVREEAYSPNQPLVTRLYSPQPNPARARVAIRYTLDATRQTLLQVHDLTGRVVRTLCASSMKRGAYSVNWNGTDDRGRSLANGVYFCRLTAGDFRATEKLVLQR
jgi:hypothetical protein